MNNKTFVYVRGKKEGPFSHEEIQQKLKRGEIGLYDTAVEAGKNILVKQLLQSFTINQPAPASIPVREAQVKEVPPSEPVALSVAPQIKPPHLASANRHQAARDFVEAELASPGSRLAAQILDGLLYVIVLLPAFIGGVSLLGKDKDDKSKEFYAGLVVGGVLLWLVLILIQGVFLCSKGQTLGKKMMGIRIVNSDDLGNPGFGRVFLLRYCANTLLTMIPWIGWIYSLIDLLFIFRGDRRCVHDLMAMTRVIRS
jgi:uncharacterized RDD family membrane protein YckC